MAETKVKRENNINAIPEGYNANLCWPGIWVVKFRHYDPGILRHFTEEFSSFEETMNFIKSQGLFERHDASPIQLTWRSREMWRTCRDNSENYFIDGNGYTKRKHVLPIWHKQSWWNDNENIHQDHFVFSKNESPELLYYTQTNEKGQRNIKTPIKPGRYLSKFFGDILSEKEIAFFAQWQITGVCGSSFADRNTYLIKFATTPDEIERVYKNGPTSCMSGSGGRFESETHPCRVYGAGDLAVVYLQHKDVESKMEKKNLPRQGQPVARCLVWPEKKVAGRIYPNVGEWEEDGFQSFENAKDAYNELKNYLIEQNYDFQGSFEGAKLLYIPFENKKAVMPYIDGDYSVSLNGDHFVITEEDEDDEDDEDIKTFGVKETCGHIRIRFYYCNCDNCETEIKRARDSHCVFMDYTIRYGSIRGRNGRSWCEDCVSNSGFVCEATDITFSRNVDFYETSTGFICQAAIEDGRWYICAFDDLAYNSGDKPFVLLEDGRKMTEENFKYHGFECSITKKNYHEDNLDYQIEDKYNIKVSDGISKKKLNAWIKENNLEEILENAD